MTDIMFSIGNLLFNMWNKINEFVKKNFLIFRPLINITTDFSHLFKKKILWGI